MNPNQLKQIIMTVVDGLENKIEGLSNEIKSLKSNTPSLDKILEITDYPKYGKDWTLSDEDIAKIQEDIKPVEGVDYFVKDGKDAEITDALISRITKLVQAKVKNGRDGIDGLDGRDGKDGKDGQDGSEDTPEVIADKLNSLEAVLDWSVLKDFDSLVNQNDLKSAVQTLENQTRFLIQKQTSSSVSTGVSSINSLTGAVTLAAGSGITLTPVGNTITIASTGGAGVELGGAQTGFTNDMIQYIDNAGLQGGDVLFLRDSTTNYTDILKDFSVSEQSGFRIIADVLNGAIIGNTFPGSFATNENSVTNLISFSGTGDVSGLNGAPDGTIPTATMSGVINSSTLDNAISRWYYYDGSIGGTAQMQAETIVQNGAETTEYYAQYRGFGMSWNDGTISSGLAGGYNGTFQSVAISTDDNSTGYSATVNVDQLGPKMQVTPEGGAGDDWTLWNQQILASDEAFLFYSNITENKNFFYIKPSTGEYKFGDNDARHNGNYIYLDDTNEEFNVFTKQIDFKTPLLVPLVYIDDTIIHTRLGYQAGGDASLLAGGSNTYVGYQAGRSASGSLAQGNVAVGYQALYSLATGGDSNTAVGLGAGKLITTGQNNSLYGYGAGDALTTESNNAIFGSIAGGLLTGTGNAYFGYNSGGQATTSDHGTFIGNLAGLTVTTGDSNVLIGSGADVTTGTFAASIGIGRDVSITASNQFKMGSAAYPILDAYIGDHTGVTYMRSDSANRVNYDIAGYAGAGTVADATGLYAQVNNTSTGTITNSYGVRIADTNTGGGSVGVSTGLYISALSGSTKYGVYVDIANSSNVFHEIRVRSAAAIKFFDSDNTNFVSFKSAAAVGSDVAWTLPSTDAQGAFISDGSGAMSIKTLNNGTYTPTLTAVTNVTATTARQCTWMRVGNTVTVAGQCDIDPTGTGTVVLGISLPVASNFSTAYQAGGAGHAPTTAGHGAAIYADATNDRVELSYVDSVGSNDTMTFTFTYEVI